MNTQKSRGRLSKHEAQQLAKELIGPLGYARRRNGLYEVGELVSICDDRVQGCSNRSWREAFHDAGLFWT